MAKKKKKQKKDENQPSKLKELMVKFKFDNHHKMERFVVISIVFFFLFSGVLAGATVKYRGLQKTQDLNQVIYTPEFTTSLSQTQGKVVGVYRNNDWNKVYLMLFFGTSEDMTYDVSNYKVGISSWHHQIETKPSGVVQVFGTTGYVGIELDSSVKFPNDVWKVLVRLNTTSEVTSEMSNKSGKSTDFEKYDQCQIGINFGAKGVVYDKVFDGNPTPSDIYKVLACGEEENTIKKDLQMEVNDMARAQKKVEEAKKRLVELGVQVPKLSDYYNGDLFVVSNEDGVELNKVETLEGTEQEKIVGYTYKPKSVYRGGYEFNWQTTDLVHGGYLKQVVPQGEDAETFLEQQDKLADDTYTYLDEGMTEEEYDAYALDMGEEDDLDDYIWVWSETGTEPGKEIDLTSDLPRITNISDVIEDFTSNYDSYLNLKKKYQKDDLRRLLYLELQADDLDKTASISVSDDAVIVW